jgi:hypothetical protein
MKRKRYLVNAAPTQSFEEYLAAAIQQELRADYERWFEIEEEGEWAEIVLDMPSPELADLLKRIPADQQEEYYQMIGEFIRALVSK